MDVKESQYRILIDLGDIKWVVGVPESLATFLRTHVNGDFAWETLLRSGAAAIVPLVDPLQQTEFARTTVSHDPRRDPLDQDTPSEAFRRLAALEKIVFAPVETEAMAAPPRTDQRSLNAERLVRAYGVLSDKDVRVKLTCEGRRPSDCQEIYIDLPAEKG